MIESNAIDDWGHGGLISLSKAHFLRTFEIRQEVYLGISNSPASQVRALSTCVWLAVTSGLETADCYSFLFTASEITWHCPSHK